MRSWMETTQPLRQQNAPTGKRSPYYTLPNKVRAHSVQCGPLKYITQSHDIGGAQLMKSEAPKEALQLFPCHCTQFTQFRESEDSNGPRGRGQDIRAKHKHGQNDGTCIDKNTSSWGEKQIETLRGVLQSLFVAVSLWMKFLCCFVLQTSLYQDKRILDNECVQ